MAAFLEENVIKPADTVSSIASATAASAAAADGGSTATQSTLAMARNGVSLERRVRQELIDQGLLSADDFAAKDDANDATAGDEILDEIQRVRTELATIAEYNYAELQKLRQQAKTEMRRLEVKRQLDVVDQKIVEMCKQVAQKRRRLTESERTDVLRLTEQQKRLSDQLETFNR